MLALLGHRNHPPGLAGGASVGVLRGLDADDPAGDGEPPSPEPPALDGLSDATHRTEPEDAQLGVGFIERA